MKTALNPTWVKTPGATSLVLIAHGFGGSPSKLMPMVARLREENPSLRSADFVIPHLPFGPLSFASPYRVLARLYSLLDAVFESGRYRTVTLVGASMGGLFVRRLFLCARGDIKDAPHEPQLLEAFGEESIEFNGSPRPWSDNVDRIVLLAAINRGWTISHVLGPLKAMVWRIAVTLATLLSLVGLRHILLQARRGTVFVTQMRIQWMRLGRELEKQRVESGNKRTPHLPLCVQLLGSQDDVVSPEDSVDLVSGHDFYYLDVHATGHASITKFRATARRPEAQQRQEETITARCSKIVTALTGTDQQLLHESVIPADDVITPEPSIKKVVFVVHGIRDRGYWTHKIARAARQRYHETHPNVHKSATRVIATETSSYGYFPALSFIVRSRRHDKTVWLVDEYAEALARYPNADFSFVGHSNGTYLLAHALEMYPAIRFDRAVLAGSVIRRTFLWKDHASQVDSVLNYTATRDLVLALLTKPLQRISWFDIGAAGHDGFVAKADNTKQAGPVKGGHAAAIAESQWPEIAEFVINGAEPPGVTDEPTEGRSKVATVLGVVSPVLLLAFIAGAAWLGYALWHWSLIPEWASGLAVVAYVYLLLAAFRKL